MTDELAKAAAGFNVRTYAKYVLKEGTRDEKRAILERLLSNFVLKDGLISTADAHHSSSSLQRATSRS